MIKFSCLGHVNLLRWRGTGASSLPALHAKLLYTILVSANKRHLSPAVLQTFANLAGRPRSIVNGHSPTLCHSLSLILTLTSLTLSLAPVCRVPILYSQNSYKTKSRWFVHKRLTMGSLSLFLTTWLSL